MTTELEQMLHEAGFRPCYVKDIAEGDTITIRRPSFSAPPTEMVVRNLWDVRTSDGNVIRHWIGDLPGGLSVHCTYGHAFECWRKAES